MGCFRDVCTSEEPCCGTAPPHPLCFDHVFFTPQACCNISAAESHPEVVLQDIYNVLGTEQEYQRITARRLEHLSSLALPISRRKVLELGARTGDLTHFFTDRGCNVTVVEPRHINLAQFRIRLSLGKLFPNPERVKLVSMDLETSIPEGTWHVALCYGLLYHLSNPEAFLQRLAPRVSDFLILETITSSRTHMQAECRHCASMALSGVAKRLPREEIFRILKSLFPFVYVPATQPHHEQFRTNWNMAKGGSRAIFLASRHHLSSPVELLQRLPRFQRRGP